MAENRRTPTGVKLLCGAVVLGSAAPLTQALSQFLDGGLATLNSLLIVGYVGFGLLVCRGLWTMRSWGWWGVMVVGALALFEGLALLAMQPVVGLVWLAGVGIVLAYVYSLRDAYG